MWSRRRPVIYECWRIYELFYLCCKKESYICKEHFSHFAYHISSLVFFQIIACVNHIIWRTIRFWFNVSDLDGSISFMKKLWKKSCLTSRHCIPTYGLVWLEDDHFVADVAEKLWQYHGYRCCGSLYRQIISDLFYWLGWSDHCPHAKGFQPPRDLDDEKWWKCFYV